MTQPDGTVSQVLVRAYRAQHVAGLQTGPGAGRARGQRDVLESHEEALAIHTGEGEVDTAGVAGGGAAVADNRLKVFMKNMAPVSPGTLSSSLSLSL